MKNKLNISQKDCTKWMYKSLSILYMNALSALYRPDEGGSHYRQLWATMLKIELRTYTRAGKPVLITAKASLQSPQNILQKEIDV